ncbi:DUF4097 family beta strand repeat-containing protein [Hymenobacter guriensis]|uniref:DUF4097 family beta strand repeat protein n=1 Tax=Hymenobacter guriensis TaxID=2793065 RepID=A0ABS0L795_9BACT|nr:DUF4097 family beta strand repeat-containing protein [Hymenobacter guriensis]MBG8555972.1 DUF4097 family beta strand repeat protein [Hymenobacter guriensis]
MKTTFLALALGFAATAATAQTTTNFSLTCKDGDGRSSQKQFCETRDLTLASPGTATLLIDGRANGGITVHGYDGTEVKVRAKVSAWARSAEAAQKTAQGISISTKGNKLRAEGSENGWAVSYEVFVPRHTALNLKTINGGIHVDHVSADIAFDATNGGISLEEVGGNVKGNTTNGGLSIKLAGEKWTGAGLDVSTTNGGITWQLPKSYSARFYTSTNMGGINSDLPVTKTGMMSKEVATTLGSGGAPIRAVTTNGGITVRQ